MKKLINYYKQTRTINGYEGGGDRNRVKQKQNIKRIFFVNLTELHIQQKIFYQIHNNIRKEHTYISMFKRGQNFFLSNKSVLILRL